MSVHHAQENVLQRVLQLPVVSSTCETLQRKYSSTKESHPLMASVCEVYERGVQGAGALAMWGMEPVVRRLEPQCESVCQEGRGRGARQSIPWGDSAGTSPCWHSPGTLLTVLLPKAVAVANNLACRGLDHLEEKIPALQYPVDKVSHRQDNLGPLTVRLL